MYVDSLISALGLDKVRYQLVGDASKRALSGGERKRVNIGLELVAAPQMLALDEPTSGLDAKTALDLMELLKKLATNGIIIICAIHHKLKYLLFLTICCFCTLVNKVFLLRSRSLY